MAAAVPRGGSGAMGHPCRGLAGACAAHYWKGTRSIQAEAFPLPPETPAGPDAASSPPVALPGWPTLRWPLLVCGYFAFQAVLRRLLGGGLTLDEAEMLLWSRTLAWGYGSQPPLYSWLQWLVFQGVPDRLLALALLKNALLAATYLAVYRLLRFAHPRPVAGVAALSLFLLPQISWESQRDLTHSVLVTAMAALTALAFWGGALGGRRLGWPGFGLAVGLGLLAKPNFVPVPLALVVAAASLADLRGRLSAGGLAVAALVAAAVVAMPAAWVLANPDLGLGSVGKLGLGLGGGSGVGTALAGLGSLAGALAGLLGLAAVVLGAVWRLRRRVPAAPAASAAQLDRLLLRSVLWGVGFVAVAIVLGGLTDFRDRWLIPVVYLLAPLGTLRVLAAAGPAAARDLLRVTAGLAALVVVALVIHFRYGRPGHPSLMRAPVAEVAAALAARHPEAVAVVAEPAWLAGNLIFRRPDLPVVSARNPGAAPAGPAVAVWWDGDRGRFIAEALSARWGGAVRLGPAERLSAPFPVQGGVPFEVDMAPVVR